MKIFVKIKVLLKKTEFLNHTHKNNLLLLVCFIVRPQTVKTGFLWVVKIYQVRIRKTKWDRCPYNFDLNVEVVQIDIIIKINCITEERVVRKLIKLKFSGSDFVKTSFHHIPIIIL